MSKKKNKKNNGGKANNGSKANNGGETNNGGKAKTEYIFSPKGVGKWVTSLRPAVTEWKPDGIWQADLILEGKEAEELRDRITLAIDKKAESISESGKKGEPVYDPSFVEQDDGTILFKFRQDAVIKPRSGKASFEPRFECVDKEGNPWSESNGLVGNGSTIRVVYQPYLWNIKGEVGCKLRLRGVQVLDHIEYEGNGASSGPIFGQPTGAINFNEDDDDGDDADIPF